LLNDKGTWKSSDQSGQEVVIENSFTDKSGTWKLEFTMADARGNCRIYIYQLSGLPGKIMLIAYDGANGKYFSEQIRLSAIHAGAVTRKEFVDGVLDVNSLEFAKYKKENTGNVPSIFSARSTFMEFYEPFKGSNEAPVRMGLVIRNYNIKQYKRALYEADHISPLMGFQGKDPQLECYKSFYKGLCYMELQYFDSALLHFSQALAYEKSVPQLVPDIYWYRAMAYLRQNDSKNALADLGELSARTLPTEYDTNAKQIILKLNN
jgi:tetratricopeptide (TPR) repeat protein